MPSSRGLAGPWCRHDERRAVDDPRRVCEGARVNRGGLLIVGIVLVSLWAADGAVAKTFEVTRAGDTAPNGCNQGGCTLREAIIAANDRAGADEVVLRSGRTHMLTIPGIDEDLAATGDFDILGPTTIRASGRGSATVDGEDIDRVFHAVARLQITRLIITDGSAPAGLLPDGGGILATANVDLSRTRVTGNSAFGAGDGAFVADAGLIANRTTFAENEGTGIVQTGSGGVRGSRLRVTGNLGTGISEEDGDGIRLRRSVVSQNDSTGVQEFGPGSVDAPGIRANGNGSTGIQETQEGNLDIARAKIAQQRLDRRLRVRRGQPLGGEGAHHRQRVDRDPGGPARNPRHHRRPDPEQRLDRRLRVRRRDALGFPSAHLRQRVQRDPGDAGGEPHHHAGPDREQRLDRRLRVRRRDAFGFTGAHRRQRVHRDPGDAGRQPGPHASPGRASNVSVGAYEFDEGALRASRATFSRNGGSGLQEFGDGPLVLSRSLVIRNQDSGVQVFGEGASRIVRSTIALNETGGLGGGLFTDSEVVIRDSTIARNVGIEGGGIFAASGAEVTVVNSTVANNESADVGAGIYAGDGSVVTLNAVTVARNDAGNDGGGLYLQGPGGQMQVDNSLIALNTVPGGGFVGADCFNEQDPFESGGHNLLSTDDNCSGFDGPGDAVQANPRIGQLKRNGGPTETVALKNGSPAIGKAGNDAPGKDQRGRERDNQPDIGAFER